MTRPRLIPLTLLVLLPLTASNGFGASDDRTALGRYVAAPDPSYRYELVSTLPSNGVTVSVLRLTSQTWLTEKEVDHPDWQHWLTVVRPSKVNSSTGLLFITGGGRDRAAPKAPDRNLAGVAMATGTVRFSGEERNVSAKSSSFHEKTKMSSALVASPGSASGRKTRRND